MYVYLWSIVHVCKRGNLNFIEQAYTHFKGKVNTERDREKVCVCMSAHPFISVCERETEKVCV